MSKKNYENTYIRFAVAELKSYRELISAIAVLSKKKRLIEDRIHDISAVDYESLRVSGNPPHPDTVEDYMDIQNKICKLEANKDSLKITIEIKLGMLDEEERQILQMYYIDRKSIYDIANLLNYSERWVIGRKRKALDHYSKLFL